MGYMPSAGLQRAEDADDMSSARSGTACQIHLCCGARVARIEPRSVGNLQLTEATVKVK
jgi:hypothetical protein